LQDFTTQDVASLLSTIIKFVFPEISIFEWMTFMYLSLPSCNCKRIPQLQNLIQPIFRNACTKSGSLRFSQFSGCWLILSVYILMSFDFPFVRSSVILLLPLFPIVLLVLLQAYWNIHSPIAKNIH
jgi:hypothetical protein